MKTISEYINENVEIREEYMQMIRQMLDDNALGAPEGYDFYGYTLMNTTIARYKPWEASPQKCNSELSEQALYNVLQMNSLAPKGLGYELGIFEGGVSRMLMDAGRDMVCFDTFEGIVGSESIDNLKDGEYCTKDEQAVRDLLEGAEIVKGDVSVTLQHRNEKVAFVHMDMDVYVPTYYALHNIWPRLKKGGVIMCDDYGVWCTKGVTGSVDVFLDIVMRAKTIYFPTGQIAIIK